MKRTFITIALASQMLAGIVLAQTATITTENEASGMDATFGSDWSTTLGSSMLSEDRKTVRPAEEITAQWSKLSDADKEMIRRDCMVYMQMPGADGDAASTDTTAGSTANTAVTTESGTAADASVAISVSKEQMEQICAATKDF